MGDILIIRNGKIIKNGKIVEGKDLYIADGKISKKFDDEEGEIIDASGCYIASGFTDIHVHVFENTEYIGINADKVGVKQGVTTVVDAGSTGLYDYPQFKKEIIDKNDTEVLFMLNIARKGLTQKGGELHDLEDLIRPNELENLLEIEKNIMGLKVRLSSSVVGDNDIKPLIYARALSEKFDLPLMIHIGNAPPRLDSILNLLQKGDIVTHCFHGKKENNILKFEKEFEKAYKRGVRFDIGHGTESFSYETAEEFIGKYDIPYSISTDIYEHNYEYPVKSLMTTMSKFLTLDNSIEDVVNRVTTLPNMFLNKKDKNRLKIGDKADITIFKIVPKEVELFDSEGYQINVNKMIEPYITIKDGKVLS